MSQPHPGHASGTWPDQEWQDAEPEYGLVYEAPDEDVYLPGTDDGDFWGPADRHRRWRWRVPRGLIPVAGLLGAALAAITVIMIAHHGAARPPAAGTPAAGTPGAAGTPAAGTPAAGTGQRPPGATAPAAAPAAPAALTRAQAAQVLTRYARINNTANEQRSDSLLASIEAGTSYALDIGAYRFQRADNPAGTGYVPFAPVRATYYIPRTRTWPRWFAAAVTYAALASPGRPTGTGWLLFTQPGPAAPWKEILEPYTLPGTAPRIATGPGGYATAVTTTTAGPALALPPAQAPRVTAAFLDRPPTSATPANLADLRDKAFWRARMPAGSAVTDTHQPAPGPVYGLRTTDGGALLFYALTARLTLTPPPGHTFTLNIPGYYTPGHLLAFAAIGYTDQFATYDPPRGHGNPRITADASSITARG